MSNDVKQKYSLPLILSCHHSIGNKVSFGGLSAHCPGVITAAELHPWKGEAAPGFYYMKLTARKEKIEL
jgi:hypothetical protein